jgi:hypothetical protein
LQSLKKSDYSEDLDVDGRAVTQYTLKKQGVRMWAGVMWPRTEIAGGFL